MQNPLAQKPPATNLMRFPSDLNGLVDMDEPSLSSFGSSDGSSRETFYRSRQVGSFLSITGLISLPFFCSESSQSLFNAAFPAAENNKRQEDAISGEIESSAVKIARLGEELSAMRRSHSFATPQPYEAVTDDEQLLLSSYIKILR